MNPPRKEKEWLSFIDKNFSSYGALVGNGDDGAVLKKASWCITTDLLMEGVDFEKGWAPAEAVGWKSLAVNLSDLAAMGSKPLFFLVSLAIPSRYKDIEIENLLLGIKALAAKEKVSLLGGDLSRSPDKLVISITALGSQGEKPLLRGKARVGDSIYVSSHLGAPKEALKMFKKGTRLKVFPLKNGPAKENALADRFFRPPSQSKLGQILAEKRIASSAIDISDGLLLDLSRLLAKCRLGAVLQGEAIPRAKNAEGAFVSVEDAVTSGEEQTLLITVPKSKERLLENIKAKLFKIGFVSPKSGIWMERKGKISKLEAAGFDHFE
jgi:thiamine-monophosphate kinase